MDPGAASSRQSPPLQHLEGRTAGSKDAELISSSGALPLRLRTNSKSTGSPQPSPLSQSTSAADTVADPESTAPGVRIGPQMPDVGFSAEAGQDDLATNSSPTVPDSLPHEERKTETESMAAIMQGREPDPIPSSLIPNLSGHNSPDARLEKEYHRDKKGETGTEVGDESRDSSTDEESGSRGRQRSREKKHYRKDSNVSASDTDGASANETSASSSKKPPRKLKTFEPLRKKYESRCSCAKLLLCNVLLS